MGGRKSGLSWVEPGFSIYEDNGISAFYAVDEFNLETPGQPAIPGTIFFE